MRTRLSLLGRLPGQRARYDYVRLQVEGNETSAVILLRYDSSPYYNYYVASAVENLSQDGKYSSAQCI